MALPDGSVFRCITCNRGPPFTKKYAKNQCQTCYKKEKKFRPPPSKVAGMWGLD